MSGFIRQIKLDDGTPITPPSTVATSAASYAVFANDAAYEAAFPGPTAGAVYYNSTECIVREYDGTNWVYSQQAYNSTEDSTSTGVDQELALEPYNIVRFTEGSLESIIGLDPSKVKVLYLSNEQGGQSITLKNQDGGATAGFEIITGTGDDLIIEDGQTIPLVHDGDRTAWLVVGGVGGGGGLENVVVDDTSSPVTVEVGKRYLADSTNGAIIFNLPQISSIPGSKEALANVVITDCSGTAQTNNLTVNAFAGDDIDFQDGTTDTALTIDMQGQTVGFSRVDANTWCQSSGLQPSVISDGGGTGQGAKNYVLSPDDSSEIATTGGVAVIDTTTLADLPEESKEKGVLVTQTAGSAGDKATWNVNPIDDGDNARIGTNEIYIKPQAGYVDDDATVRWVDATTGEIFGETDIKTTTTYISGASLELAAGNDLAPEIEFNVSDSTGLVVSGVGVLAQNPLVAGLSSDFQAAPGFIYPTGWGTTTAETNKRKRIGDSYQYNCFVRAGEVSLNPMYIELDHDVDVSKLSPLAGSTTFYMTDVIGHRVFNGGAGDFNSVSYMVKGYVDETTPNRLHFSDESTNASALTARSVSNILTNSDGFLWIGMLPVVGFNDSGLAGSDLEASNARGSFQDTSGQSIPTGTWTKLTFNTTINDGSNGLWSSNRFTAVKRGYLSLSCYRLWASVMNSASTFMRITVNGVDRKEHKQDSGSSSQEPVFISSTGIYLERDDYVELEVFHGEGGNRSFTTTATENWIDFHWVSDKSTTLTGFPLSTSATANKQYLVPEMREATVALVNSGAQNINGTLYLLKIGNMVFLDSNGPLTHDLSATPATAAGVIPEAFRPPTQIKYNCFFYNETAGYNFAVSTNGTLTMIYRDEVGGSSGTDSVTSVTGCYSVL